jgi:copper resistance protein C
MTMRTKLKIIVTSALLLTAPYAASAHAFLKHAQPAVGSTVKHAPSKVTLWFTEELEGKFSTVVVHNAKGASEQIGKAKVNSGDKTEMSVGLKPLKAGTYTVVWHALSVDTHRTHGSFKFTVAH